MLLDDENEDALIDAIDLCSCSKVKFCNQQQSMQRVHVYKPKFIKVLMLLPHANPFSPFPSKLMASNNFGLVGSFGVME